MSWWLWLVIGLAAVMFLFPDLLSGFLPTA